MRKCNRKLQKRARIKTEEYYTTFQSYFKWTRFQTAQPPNHNLPAEKCTKKTRIGRDLNNAAPVTLLPSWRRIFHQPLSRKV